jgi:phosphoserine phosphatase
MELARQIRNKQKILAVTRREEREMRDLDRDRSKWGQSDLRGEKVLTGVEGLQVSFVADVADEVGESLLLDAPQDAAHHRRHGYRRHAGEGVRTCGGN